MISIKNKATLRRKGFVSPCSPSGSKVRAGTQGRAWRQEQSRGHRGLLLTGFLQMPFQSALLCNWGLPAGESPVLSRLVSPISVINEKIPQICPQANLLEVFSQLKFFTDDISLCLADKKPGAQRLSSQLLWDSGVLLGTHKLPFLLSWDTGSVNSLWMCNFLINKEPLRSETTAVFEWMHSWTSVPRQGNSRNNCLLEHPSAAWVLSTCF